MARAMNVEKRVVTLHNLLAKARAYASRAEQIAAELTESFKDNKTPAGKRARQIAAHADKIADLLRGAADKVKL